MVGPISTEDRSSATLKLKVGLITIVAASAGLISIKGDASLSFVLVAVALGAVVGGVLVWFVFPGTGETRRDDDDRRFERR